MYGRTLEDGTVLTLAASGWTWNGIFVLQDYETGSLWFPGLSFAWTTPWLVCVAGPLQGERLSAVEFQRTIWWRWYEDHPATRLLLVIER